MRILSFFKLLIDIAIAIETATGRPSGIDTIKITTPIMAILLIFNKVSFSNKLRSSLKQMRKNKKIACVIILHMKA